jgi:hypothetical protein
MLLLAVVLLSTVALTALVGGCADTARGRFVQTQDVYITATQALIAARKRGDIDTTTWKEDVLPLIRAGDQALDQYDAATQSGADPTASYELALNILQRLRALAVKYAAQR